MKKFWKLRVLHSSPSSFDSGSILSKFHLNFKTVRRVFTLRKVLKFVNILRGKGDLRVIWLLFLAHPKTNFLVSLSLKHVFKVLFFNILPINTFIRYKREYLRKYEFLLPHSSTDCVYLEIKLLESLSKSLLAIIYSNLKQRSIKMNLHSKWLGLRSSVETKTIANFIHVKIFFLCYPQTRYRYTFRSMC